MNKNQKLHSRDKQISKPRMKTIPKRQESFHRNPPNPYKPRPMIPKQIIYFLRKADITMTTPIPVGLDIPVDCHKTIANVSGTPDS
ncbi:hypothetical protein T265_03073 [Opisthorchis viverrini]|uniref:Uncharacterized protein n=1 Tax=Opisthorchis viverrini TaxID=6198 RepID=A0A075AHT8_OPIVI|nr:hypothetical protein T265_03073 [Opisthorchis viverrini]KER30459.1 hypothetical protein T265_03073 [Opisthorchis viverrini]